MIDIIRNDKPAEMVPGLLEIVDTPAKVVIYLKSSLFDGHLASFSKRSDIMEHLKNYEEYLNRKIYIPKFKDFDEFMESISLWLAFPKSDNGKYISTMVGEMNEQLSLYDK